MKGPENGKKDAIDQILGQIIGRQPVLSQTNPSIPRKDLTKSLHFLDVL